MLELSEITIKCCDITKIKKFKNATVFYTKKDYWVCIPEQKLPEKDDVFIALILKGKCDKK